jgi:MtfA peptidase
MFQWFKKWQREKILRHSQFTDRDWDEAFQRLKLLHRLSEKEKVNLKQLAILFLHYKSLEVVGDIELNTTMQLAIALQACLPILNLGLDWYDGWVSVVIYPGAFSKKAIEMDAFGIEHERRVNLSGESWLHGPVILSLDDVMHDGEENRENVVIHEFAHKLDMINGSANGFPPLHKNMSIQQWSEVFNHAYKDLIMHQQGHDPIPINPYAATSPAEFFAVLSEYFFEKPAILVQHYPDIYDMLAQFYRQNPLNS